VSSRAEEKREAREARLAAEAEQQRAAGRRRRIYLLGGSLLLAAIVVAALVLVSQGNDAADSEAGDVSFLDGIPERGIALGDPEAPVTIVEFADPQCPFCAEFSREALPALVERYVKSGKVRMELRLLDFIGPDSTRLAGAAHAASLQGGLWRFADLAYARQGPENSGYADDAFIESVAADAGLDAERVLAGVDSEGARSQLEEAKREAQAAGVEATPAFLIGPTGGDLEPIEVDGLDASSFEGPIDAALEAAG